VSIEIRQAAADEMRQFGDLTAYAYAGAFGDGDENQAMHSNRPEWLLCAFDGPRMVASYGTIPFTARANGQAVPLGGVTTVATAPEYRRRGLLRSITERALNAQREAGQPVAALWASQAAIYQRYGYSAASALVHYEIDTADLNLLEPPTGDLQVAREPAADAFEDVKQVYRAFVAPRTLYLHRSSVLWQASVLGNRPGSGPIHCAVCRNAAGEARGYVVYTLRSAVVGHATRAQEIVVRDLVWLDVDACRTLWAFLARHDLVGRIRWEGAPVDDPLTELLIEPRLCHRRAAEGVWLRIVDAAGALSARGYDQDGELILDIESDRLTPWNDGRWRLTVSNGTATVERTTAQPELSLTTKALASLWCGYRTVGELVGWGLIEADRRVVPHAGALLATRHAPHCPDHF
jgi:predicted acetyltransferase